MQNTAEQPTQDFDQAFPDRLTGEVLEEILDESKSGKKIGPDDVTEAIEKIFQNNNLETRDKDNSGLLSKVIENVFHQYKDKIKDVK